MIRDRIIFHLAFALGLSAARFAPAQPIPPFFGGGTVAYDPEISTVQSGAIMDSQATVSEDRKYVTINMRGTNSKLQSLQTYPTASIPQGFVGGVNLNNVSNGTRANFSPDQIQREANGWILSRQGMYLVKPLP